MLTILILVGWTKQGKTAVTVFVVILISKKSRLMGFSASILAYLISLPD